MEQVDPHHRTNTVITACLKYPNGLGLNELSDITGIHKETLYKILEQKHIFDVKKIKDSKSKGNSKFSIRLKQMIQQEDTIFDMINVHFQAYLDEFPKMSRTVQIESIVHFLQTLSAMQMIVYMNHLNTNTSFEVSQQIIQNHLANFKAMMVKMLSEVDNETDGRITMLVNQQISIAAIYLGEKAEGAMNSVFTRTKKRAIEDLLFDLDITIPRIGFIEKIIAIARDEIKNQGLGKKHFNSLPLKLKQPKTKLFKEFTQLQIKLAEKEIEIVQSFAGPGIRKQMSKISDEEYELRIQHSEELYPHLTPEQKKAMQEWLLNFRKSVKP